MMSDRVVDIIVKVMVIGFLSIWFYLVTVTQGKFAERIKNNSLHSLHNSLHCVTILKRVSKEELNQNKEDE